MSDGTNEFSFNSEGNFGQTVFIISLIVICVASTAFGCCLSATSKSSKKIRKTQKTVIRHRDPTEVVRDFEHEDDEDLDVPLDFEEEVIDIEEDALDTGFNKDDYVVTRIRLRPRPLDITKLHEKPKLQAHERRIYRT